MYQGSVCPGIKQIPLPFTLCSPQLLRSFTEAFPSPPKCNLNARYQKQHSHVPELPQVTTEPRASPQVNQWQGCVDLQQLERQKGEGNAWMGHSGGSSNPREQHFAAYPATWVNALTTTEIIFPLFCSAPVPPPKLPCEFGMSFVPAEPCK